MIIYVFDKRISDTPRTSTRESVSDIEMVIAHETDSVRHIVNDIIAAAQDERSIWLLRIICHGAPGALLLGAGVTVGNAGIFSDLQPYFTPGGRGIEIHACNVASESSSLTGVVAVSPGSARHVSDRGTPGHGTGGVGGAFLSALARAAGVPVIAGYDTQYYDREYRWEGRGTMTVEPGGTTVTTIGEEVRPR